MPVAGDFEMAVGTTPGAAATGKLKIYPSSVDGAWHQVDESNVDSVISGATGPGYTATSTTSLAIGTGSKAFTTQAGLAYTAGARVRASSDADPTVDYMEGVCTAYSGTTLTVTMDLVGGSGTHTDWDLNLAGDQGIQGEGVPPTVVAHGAMGATETFDYGDGPAHEGTVDAALTVTLIGWVAGEDILTLGLTNDGTGGYGVPTFGAEVINSADLAAVWDDTAGAYNLIVLRTVDSGTNVYITNLPAVTPDLDAVIAVSSGQDIADALSGAASPAAGNVFATIDDIPAAAGSPLLAVATYAPGTDTTIATTTSATMADIDATHLAITFTAPASGKVLVRYTGMIGFASGISYLGLREATTDLSGSKHYIWFNAASPILRVADTWYVTGISAGSHTYKFSFARSAGTMTIFGGPTDFGPVLMEVWAA